MRKFLILCLCLFAGPAFAWQLQPDASALNFVSVKKDSVGEVHRFRKFQVAVAADGAATLTIDLASVDTAIEVRDQRMRDMLFEVAKFPTATFRTRVDLQIVDTLKCGEQAVLPLKGELTLHGSTRPVATDAVVTRLASGNISVISRQPLIVTADSFAMITGVQQLAAVAGLPSISTAVPVTFALVFAPEPALKTPQAPTGMSVQ